MPLLKKILVLALVTVWSLASNHCKLEQLGGCQFLKCSEPATAANHPAEDCQSDGCASVESGFYKMEDGSPAATIPLLAHALPVLMLPETIRPVGIAHFAFDSAPPEFPPCWQFVFRTASPPRAPSLAS